MTDLSKIVGNIELLPQSPGSPPEEVSEKDANDYVSISKLLWENEEFRESFDNYNASIANAMLLLEEPKNPFIGREKELDTLKKVMEFKKDPIAILLAEAGMGKTTLVRYFAKMVNEGKMKGTSRKYVVLEVQIGLMSAMGLDKFQAGLQQLLSEIEHLQQKAREVMNDNSIHFILFIDEIHTVISIFGPGSKIGGDLLKSSLTPAKVCVVGATTRKEYDRSIALDDPLKERFTPIEFQKFTHTELQNILLSWWDDLGGNEIAPLQREFIDKVLEFGQRYKEESSEPRRSIKIIQGLEAWCRIDQTKPSLKVVADIFRSLYGVHTNVRFNTADVLYHLEHDIIGQDMAKFQIMDFFKRFNIRVGRQRSRPLGVFFFVGPTGVGKTETARIINRVLYDGEANMKFINTPDYSMIDEGDLVLRRDIGEEARHHPQTIFLIDEVEKGVYRESNKVKNNLLPTFLSLTDNGKVIYDARNKEGDRETYSSTLQNTCFIFTSNAGHEVFEGDEKRGDEYDETKDTPQSRAKRKELESSVKERLLKTYGFTPEFLGRMDKFVLYKRLSQYHGVKIAERLLNQYLSDLELERGIVVELNKPSTIKKDEIIGAPRDFEAQEIAVFLATVRVDMTDSRSGGARKVKTAVEDEIEELIARTIYEDESKKHFKLTVPNRGILLQNVSHEEMEVKLECLG